MPKLITPPGILLTVAFLAIYCAYAFITAWIERSWILAVAGVGAAFACFGTALLRPWSRFLVYALVGSFLGKVTHSVYSAAVAGYFAFYFGSVGTSLRSLVPSLLMAVLSCVCCFIVFNYFRSVRAGGGATAVPVRREAKMRAPYTLQLQVPSELLWLAATFSALIVGNWLQSRVYLNHDVSWFGHSARWLLQGRDFGSEVLDINAPMAWLPSLPAAAIANTGLMAEPVAIRYVFWGYFLLASATLYHVLSRLDARSAAGAMGWQIAFILMATLAPAASFGQREYLSVLFAMPYLAAAAVRLQGNARLGAVASLVVGLLAGIGFSLKPYFLAVPMLVECLLLARLGWRAVWRIELITLGLVVLAYVLTVVIFMPEYLLSTVPLGRTFFWAYESSSLDVLITRFGTVAKPAVFGLLVALLARNWSAQHSVMALAGLGYSASYFIQSKGFVYHAYPVQFCSFVFLGICVASAIGSVRLRLQDSRAEVRALVVCGLILLALPAVKTGHDQVASWYFRYNSSWGVEGAKRRAIIAAVDQYAPTENSYFFAFSTHPFPGFPTASYTKANWSGRGPGQGIIPAFARLDEVVDPDLRRRIIAAATVQRQIVVEDLTRWPPSVVFADTSRWRLGMNGRKFDDLGFYLEDARFRKIWSDYQEISPIGPYRVFILRDGGPERP